MEIRYTRSARKHRISRTDALAALTDATRVLAGNARPDGTPVFIAIGLDTKGRTLEVGFVVEDDVITVIHAMPARPNRRS